MINTYDAQFTGKTELAPHVFKFSFKIIGNELRFTAGQYLIFLIPHEGKTVRRLYSIFSPDYHTKSFDVVIQLVEGGIASTRFDSLNRGEVLRAQGPAGMFTLRDTPKPKIFLATGTGIAPMVSMIDSQLTRAGADAPPMMLFWGLRNMSDTYYVEEFRGLAAKYPGFSVRICLSRESANALEGFTDIFIPGRIDTVLSAHILSHPDVAQKVNTFDYYLCGSVPAVGNLDTILKNAGVDKQNIYLEKFV